MTTLELIVLSVALAMDAVAVSLAQGLALRRPHWADAALLAVAFGLFQAGMPLLGWLLSAWFAGAVATAAPWIAFALLSAIGLKMVWDFLHDREDEFPTEPGQRALTLTAVVPLAVATSIDAFAVGVTFSVLDVDILSAVALIGSVTLALSLAAVFLGAAIGSRLGRWATLLGGVVLLLIGLRILGARLGLM